MSVNSKMTAIANAIRSLLGTSGTYSLDAMASALSGIPKKSAANYTPGSSAQTIAAGQYLSGAQTIQGDANLAAGNIRSGVSIFGVPGSLVPGITPSGTVSITANGTHDVTNYAGANVAVPDNSPRAVSAYVTIASDTGENQWVNLISSSSPSASIIAQHRDDAGLYFLFNYLSEAPSDKNGMWVVGARANRLRPSNDHHGQILRTNATGGMSVVSITGLDIKNGTSTTTANMGCPRIDSDGSVYVRAYAGYPVRAGNYAVIIGW